MINETHDPALRSWVASTNDPASEFPIQNLPFAIFRRGGSHQAFRVGVAIGDQVLDLGQSAVCAALKLDDGVTATLAQPALNGLMARGTAVWSALRLALSRALRAGSPVQAVLQGALLPQAQVEYALPARIGDYTDFYTSVYHATNVGKLFRPDNPLLPNYGNHPVEPKA